MVADAGLEHALGMAGVALDDRGSPIINEANTPVNTQPAAGIDAAQPVAPAEPITAGGDEDSERMSLEETVAALIGEGAEPAVEATATETAPAQTDAAAEPQEPLTPREIELQRQLDEIKAEKETLTVQQQIDTVQDLYDNQWNEGEKFWTTTVPGRVRAAVAEKGGSELDVARAMAVVERKYGDWKAEFVHNYETDHRLDPDSYNAPDLVTSLISEHGLSDEDRPAIQKFAANPDVMKDFAAALGSRVAALAQRDQAVNQAAAQQVNQHIAGGFAPGAPTTAPVKLPYKFQGGDRNHEEARAFSQMLQSGALSGRRS